MRLVLGTRGSALARAQSAWVAAQLQAHGLEIETVIIKTSGDLNRAAPLNTLGGKGVFTREIEEALLRGDIDFAVHSLKDLPTELPAGLTLSATPPREDPRDVLVGAQPLIDLPAGAVIGTGSLRRQVQLRQRRADLEIRDIRGNVPTRIDKWRSGEYGGGVILAMAGLNRLSLVSEAVHPLDFVPAPCQGILGLECRAGDSATQTALSPLNDPAAELQARAERAFLHALQGGCNVPAGALLTLSDGTARLEAFLNEHRLVLEAPAAQAEELGRRVALDLCSR